MVSTEPTEPYVYQPFGMNNKENWKAGRVYGVGGIVRPPATYCNVEVKGLTKEEAIAVCEAIRRVQGS